MWSLGVRGETCPAGCINEVLDFFIVNGDGVERIERTQSMDRIEFWVLS